MSGCRQLNILRAHKHGCPHGHDRQGCPDREGESKCARRFFAAVGEHQQGDSECRTALTHQPVACGRDA